MSEACTEIDARLEAVANAAALLGSRLPRVRDPGSGLWMAHGMDTLLRNLSSGCGALDVALGEGLDALTVGRRAMDLKYSNIGDYAREELNLNRIPLLRRALREKRISYEKARIIARHAEGEEVQGWVELRRAMQDKDEAQMCARGTFRVWMPVSVAEVVKAAFRAARAAAKRWLSAGECLVTL